VDCTPEALSDSAKEFQDESFKQLLAATAYSLAVAAGGSTEPESLLDSAKCFLCLSKKQLLAIWAAALCGLVGCTPPAIPASGEWDVFQSGAESIAAEVVTPASAPCPQWQIRYRLLPASEWTEVVSENVDTSTTSSGFSPGDVVEAQARWVGCSCEDSGWSDTKTVNFV
jgi:hypothetical protein